MKTPITTDLRRVLVLCPEAAFMFGSAKDLLADYNVLLTSEGLITSTCSPAIWDHRCRSNDVVLMTAEWCTDLITKGYFDISHLKHTVLRKAGAVLSANNKLEGLLETFFSVSKDSKTFACISAVTSYLDPHGTTERVFKERTKLMEKLTKCRYLPFPQIALGFEDGLLWISNNVDVEPEAAEPTNFNLARGPEMGRELGTTQSSTSGFTRIPIS